MMRPIKNFNKSLDLSYMDCGHAVRGIREINLLTWCAACDQIRDAVNDSSLDGPTKQYVDPEWQNKCEPSDSFKQLLHDVQKIHDKKKHDYSHPGDRFSNFTESGIIGSMFKNPTDISFAVLIGIKLSRLSNLLGNKLVPNNESIDDTFLDLTTYCALWATYHKDNK